MKLYKDTQELKKDLNGILELLPGNTAKIINRPSLADKLIDNLIYTYVFTDNKILKDLTCRIIRATATACGAIPASIQKFYEATAKGVYTQKTVPAINIRGITYEVARAAFRAAIKNKAGAFIFEIARSEIRYTQQEPEEYALVIIAAAIKENYQGPVFIQGDHFQVKSKKYLADSNTEINELKNLIKKAIDAGFYNIDIDASTLVDLSKPNKEEQQEINSKVTAELTEFIRQHQPAGITISVGGEIGEVGKQNSTPEELKAFMKQYRSFLKPNITGISKISVQTGTTHGGVPLPDGSIAKVDLDFNTLKELSHIARQEFGLAGAVQHGASTLPDDAFDKFPQGGTAEVHLATGFQNMIYDDPNFPKDLLNRINDYLIKNHASERKPQQTDEQFLYKTRKKTFGPFKKQMWTLPPEKLGKIMKSLEDKFSFLFQKLNVIDTTDLVNKTLAIKT